MSVAPELAPVDAGPHPSLRDVGASLIGAATVACTGFGTLSVIWFISTWPRRPGLYDYWTTTLGDALLLPTLAALLVLAHRRLQAAPAERAAALAGVIAGAAVAGTLQVAWLASADRPLNWTFASAHRFNFAGAYHAGFTIGAAASFGGMLALVAWRLRVLRTRDLSAGVAIARSPAVAVAGAVTLSFFMLLVVDDARAHSLTGATLLAASSVCAGWLVVLALVLGRAFRYALRGALISICTASALASVALLVGPP